MKINKLKIFSFALAAIVMQGTCAFAASSKEGYDKEELENLQPGWTWTDKDKSSYKVNSYKNTFSSLQPPSKEDDKDTKDQADGAIVFDQIGMTTENPVQSTWGNSGLYWAKAADGSWILLENGVPTTGWKKVNGSWYYMNSNGIMQTGWINDRGTWYYLYSGGQMAYNTYVGGYYLGESGAMVW